MLERLRRTTNVEKLYLLIRSKKGKNAKERLEELFSNTVIDLTIKLKTILI